jgi:PAS domain S-box-containing protein
MLGYDPEELLGQHWTVAVPPDQQPIVQASDKRRASGEADQYELELVHKDGTRIPTLISGSPRFEEGCFVGTLAVFTDITEHKRAQEALRRSEEQYRLLAENVTDIIWTTDMNLRFTYMSPSVARLGGYSVDEAMAMSFEELLTPASFEIAMKAFAEELAAESPRQEEAFWSRVLELEQRRKDGSTVWTEVTTSFLHDPEGQPVGIVGITRDITERKRTEEEIKRRGEELEALREMSLAITAQLELDELLQNVVERGCRLLGVGAGGIYLADESNGDLELVVSHGFTRDYTGAHLAPGEGLAGRVLQSGTPLAVDDYHRWEGRSLDWEAEPLAAAVGVPLKRGERVIGVLEFATSDRGGAFDEHDVWLATLFANQTAIAIENARLYQAEQAAHEPGCTRPSRPPTRAPTRCAKSRAPWAPRWNWTTCSRSSCARRSAC